jgi:hypothetical protein
MGKDIGLERQNKVQSTLTDSWTFDGVFFVFRFEYASSAVFCSVFGFHELEKRTKVEI